jgi:DNA-binding MurR/RpiR family transcriptional regulator
MILVVGSSLMTLSEQLHQLQAEMQETDRRLARLIGEHIDEASEGLRQLLNEIEAQPHK